MKKIVLIGSGGSGKSTLARQLGEKLEINVLHLDSLFWKPGWVETPREEWMIPSSIS
jgi:adenylate kinase family enzyme